ncbi:MAG: hypothetical protein FOGNACKC_05280 [Anaerolineae bacterium]|nr:hypothetical protein [Anaerolineae bacterium]
MTNTSKTKTQLLEELAALHQRVAELERLTVEYRLTAETRQRLLLAEREQHLQTDRLREAGAELNSSLNLEVVLDTLLRHMQTLIPGPAASIWLVKAGAARVFRWQGYAPAGVDHYFTQQAFNLADYPLLLSLQNSDSAVIVSIAEQPDSWIHGHGKEWVKSHLGVALRRPDKLIGFLNFDSPTPGYFTAGHGQLARQLASIGAAALVNAQLYDKTRQENVQRLKVVKKERKFVSAILDTTDALVLVLSPQGRILQFNRTVEALAGQPAANIRGRFFWELFRPSPELARVKASLQNSQIEQLPHQFEASWLGHGHTQRLIAWSNSVLLDQHRTAEYIISTGIDLTERKQLEERLVAIHQLGRELNLVRDEVAICRIALETTYFLLPVKSSGYGVVDPASGQLDYCYFPRRGVPHTVTHHLPLNDNARLGFLAGQRQADDAPFNRQDWLTAPMQIRERVIGVLDIQRQETAVFSAGDRQLLQTLADQTAVAIENARLHRETQQRLDELTTLTAVSQAITATLNLEETLALIANHATRLLEAQAASVVLSDENRGDLWFHSASGGAPEVMRGRRLPAGQGIVGWVIAHGEPALVADVAQDSRFFDKFDQLSGFKTSSIICVPLAAGARVIGAIEVMNKTGGPFTAEDVRRLTWLATPAAIAITNARLFEQVHTGHRQIQSLSRRLVEIQESERRLIARELHDEAGQALTSLLVGLRLLESELPPSESVSERVAGLKQITNDVSENLHRLARDLRPASLDYLGLVAALRQYTTDFGQQHKLAVQFEAIGLSDQRLPAVMEINLYRIVQEALTNVARHAQASRVDILLEQQPGRLITIIEDNGVGFDKNASAHQGRLGLLGMRERTEMLQGVLTIETNIDHGTTVYVEVPYEHTNSDS